MRANFKTRPVEERPDLEDQAFGITSRARLVRLSGEVTAAKDQKVQNIRRNQYKPIFFMPQALLTASTIVTTDPTHRICDAKTPRSPSARSVLVHPRVLETLRMDPNGRRGVSPPGDQDIARNRCARGQSPSIQFLEPNRAWRDAHGRCRGGGNATPRTRRNMPFGSPARSVSDRR